MVCVIHNREFTKIVTKSNYVSGPPDAVGNLARKGEIVSWTPPFSLDLTGVDHDIDFCLQVYNVTQKQSLLVDVCDILSPSYVVDILHDSCLYLFIVVPVIHGSSINGTLSSLRGKLV